MPFEFVCPSCHMKTKVLDRYAGQSGPCVGCGKNVTMPHFNEKGILVPSVAPLTKADKPLVTKPRSWMPAVVGATAVMTLLLAGGVVLWFAWPGIQNSMRRAAQGKDFDNLKSIATALNAYSDRYGTYPPPFVTDASGKKLYSWRVLILPFLGHEDLYKKFNLSQAWDSPANAALFREMPTEFASPNSTSALSSFETNYVLVIGPGTLFPPKGPMSYKGIDPDTLLLVETNNSVTWSEPGDIDISLGLKVGNRPMEMGGLHKESFTAVTTAGETLRLPSDISQTMLNALITPNGGEKVQTNTYKD